MPLKMKVDSPKFVTNGLNDEVCLSVVVRRISLYVVHRPTRKPTIYISEIKAADQLRSDREADQRLCFRNTDSTISLLFKSEISSC